MTLPQLCVFALGEHMLWIIRLYRQPMCYLAVFFEGMAERWGIHDQPVFCRELGRLRGSSVVFFPAWFLIRIRDVGMHYSDVEVMAVGAVCFLVSSLCADSERAGSSFVSVVEAWMALSLL